MRLSFPVLLAAWLALAPAPAGAADDDYDAMRARALKTESAAYDKALSTYFNGVPGLFDKFTACQAHADKGSLVGYFEFPAAGGYRLVLRPRTKFAACMAAAFAGYAPPTPPRRPYLHGFSFVLHNGPKPAQ
jgi:hypothetical protein